jgi:hypothetical protein
MLFFKVIGLMTLNYIEPAQAGNCPVSLVDIMWLIGKTVSWAEG